MIVHTELGPTGFTVVAQHDGGVTVVAMRSDESFAYATLLPCEAEFVRRSICADPIVERAAAHRKPKVTA